MDYSGLGFVTIVTKKQKKSGGPNALNVDKASFVLNPHKLSIVNMHDSGQHNQMTALTEPRTFL